MRIGMIGFGAIGSRVSQAFRNGEIEKATLAHVLVLRERESRPPELPADTKLTTDVDDFYSTECDVVVEVAGQPAVREHALRCLKLGRTFLLTSVGSLTDEALHAELNEAARLHNAQLLLCSGSMPGLDWMGSAALVGCSRVAVTQSKPPQAWIGTPAAEKFDLLALTEPTVLFKGTAREAASLYPKNSNVVATLAITTAGLDAVEVTLMTYPGNANNTTQVEFEGPAGKLKIELEGAPSPTNPKTSYVVPLAVIKAIRNISSPMACGV